MGMSGAQQYGQAPPAESATNAPATAPRDTSSTQAQPAAAFMARHGTVSNDASSARDFAHPYFHTRAHVAQPYLAPQNSGAAPAFAGFVPHAGNEFYNSYPSISSYGPSIAQTGATDQGLTVATTSGLVVGYPFGQPTSLPAFGQPTSLPGFGQPTSLPAFGQPAPTSEAEGKVTFPASPQTSVNSNTLKLHDKTVHQKQKTWLCEYPGCARNNVPFNRNSSYRRHMREIHSISVVSGTTWKVGENSQPATMSSTSTGRDKTPADPMEAYLTGVGRQLPTDVRKRKRDDHDHEPARDLPNDSEALKEEIHRLRARERQLLEGLKVERAMARFDLQEAEKNRRAELDDTFQAHQEELRAVHNNAAFNCLQDEMKAQRDKLRAKHAKEMEAVQRKHKQNERRLWNLLNGGNPTG